MVRACHAFVLRLICDLIGARYDVLCACYVIVARVVYACYVFAMRVSVADGKEVSKLRSPGSTDRALPIMPFMLAIAIPAGNTE